FFRTPIRELVIRDGPVILAVGKFSGRPDAIPLEKHCRVIPGDRDQLWTGCFNWLLLAWARGLEPFGPGWGFSLAEDLVQTEATFPVFGGLVFQHRRIQRWLGCSVINEFPCLLCGCSGRRRLVRATVVIVLAIDRNPLVHRLKAGRLMRFKIAMQGSVTALIFALGLWVILPAADGQSSLAG